MDNCSANQTTCELDNIKLKFLPPNTTARLQPLDRSTKSFKVGYRRRLVDTLLMNLRVGTELKVDQLGAIHMMTGAWNSVKQSVANCFRKAGVGMDDTFRELSSLFPAAVPIALPAGDFVNADSNVLAVASVGDEDIVVAVAGTQADSSSGDDRPDEDAATRSYSTGELAAAPMSGNQTIFRQSVPRFHITPVAGFATNDAARVIMFVQRARSSRFGTSLLNRSGAAASGGR
ncbi:hypothetical protein HPB48_010152 [Haemaphysalis longicornis]|uniref:DDE-1 domain-containing protein n=1 Tax=Haemaphysalis longicornis TaxID=44386 RepID=A0A9J6FW80_HAELO|nr:hypothetical protein HPB48_010152 [Haemaphysalis longicornis]